MTHDTSRVVARLFIPGQELVGGSESRASSTVQRILELSDEDVATSLDDLLVRFGHRHEDIEGIFDYHAQRLVDYVSTPMTDQRRQLIGAAFTHEYSLEGAAVCNPSLVPHPDQSGVAPGALRIVMSVRAVGEGHHSSICFRSGIIDERGVLRLDVASAFPVVGALSTAPLHRTLFHALLGDLGFDGETAASVLDTLPDEFGSEDLETALAHLQTQSDTRLNVATTVGMLRLIAACSYEVSFDAGVDLSRRVLWPAAPNEVNGMEDARFVMTTGPEFARYVASYTAFDGHSVSQQLLETDDFVSFRSSPLAGQGARNKGLAFFPRQIAGRYCALSRFDRESNAVAFSDDLHQWDAVEVAQVPTYAWEVVQLGNCGPPLELAEGWLVLTHGVGPMRTYSIGALLLDLEDPTRIIGQLPQPLLAPTPLDLDGYVPNVVYSCGSLIHNGILHIPFGIADQSIGSATVPVSDLVAAFEAPRGWVGARS